MGKKIVQVKSIPRPTATGVGEFKNPDTGKSLEKNKVGDAKTTIQALRSRKVGGLRNGLSYYSWIEEGVQKIDLEGNELTEQDKMEQKWGLDKGFLNNKTSTNLLEHEPGITDSYYHTKSWTLHDGTTLLDLDNMDDELGYKVFLDHKLVANSYNEWKQHKWPYAEFYIANENESEELKYKKNERKGRALASLYAEFMTNDMKRTFAFVLELANSSVDVTDKQIYNLLHDYVDKSTFLPGSNLDKYEELLHIVKTKTGREELTARLLLRRALDSRILNERGQTYTWIRPKGTIELGSTFSEAINFLQNSKKEVLVEELRDAIKAKLF